MGIFKSGNLKMWKFLEWQFAPKLRLELKCFRKSSNEMRFYLVMSDLFVYLLIYLFIYSKIYAVHFQTSPPSREK